MTPSQENQPRQPARKQSGWMFLLHFWAGICLRTVIEASGLSKIVLGNPVIHTPEERVTYSGLATFFAIVVVVIGITLSYFLVKFIDSRNFSSLLNKTIKLSLPFIYFFAAMFTYMFLKPTLTM